MEKLAYRAKKVYTLQYENICLKIKISKFIEILQSKFNKITTQYIFAQGNIKSYGMFDIAMICDNKTLINIYFYYVPHPTNKFSRWHDALKHPPP